MIPVENILLDDAIATTHFMCDLTKCKGACCTFPGDYGAPLLDEEIAKMDECKEAATKYMSARSKFVLDQEGFYEGEPGKYTTVCINRRDCVFVYYEGDIALCALEKAYLEGETSWRKPISCHLFPIRVGNYGGEYLYYEEIDECCDALEKGKRDNISMVAGLKEPLIRAYGETWYNNLLKTISNKEK